MNADHPDPSDTPDTPNTLLQREQQLIEQAKPFAVVTVIRAAPPTSAWVGAQALVDADGTLHGWIGGGCSRAIVIEAALQAIRSGQPKRIRISNEPSTPDADVEAHTMPCASNGALELFIQPTLPAPVVLVLGATPTALEACVLAKWVGFRVCGAARATAPFASLGLQQVMEGFDVEVFNLAGAQLILVVTQGESDEEALEAALRSEAAAVLLVASARKADKLRDAMRARGIGAQRLAALHAPAGPSIHARRPQEIALGAVAGLVALRHELEQSAAAACGSHFAGSEAVPVLPPCESIASVEAPGARYVNPVCGMAIDVASAKHMLSYGGQRFYFCCDGCKVEFERDPGKYLALAQGAAHGEQT